MGQETPLDIRREALFFFSTTMNRPFPINSEAMTFAKTNFLLPEDTDQNTIRKIIVEYHFGIESLKNDFKFDIKISRPFILSPLGKITAKAVYKCATICQDEAQEYLDKIFSDYTPITRSKIEPFEELELHILKMIESFYV